MTTAAVPTGKRAAYPGYKPSGVEWLDEIPEHWQVRRLKFLFHFRNGGTPSTTDPSYWNGDIPWVSSKDMKSFRLSKTVDHITQQAVAESATSLVPAQTVLIVVRSGILRHTIPVAITQRAMAINQDIKALIPKTQTLYADYGAYLIHGNQSQLLTLWRKEGTTVESLDVESIERFEMLIPPLDEQKAIAAFLDRETARIDALIEKKRRQIELLQEKRSALISHAVTKGLDPNAPMKDSGIEWLGEVPSHWEVWKVTHGFSRISSGTTPKSDNLNYYEGDIPWVTTSELRENVIEDTQSKVTEAAIRDYSGLRLYPAGTLLFAMYGATIGRMGILGIPATVNQACAAFVGPKYLTAKFTYYWLWMRRPTLIAMSAGGGQPNLSQDDLREVRIPAPPVDEQNKIVEWLESELAMINPLVDRVMTSIEVLREYRSSLISAAVTGKIDVRGEAIYA